MNLILLDVISGGAFFIAVGWIYVTVIRRNVDAVIATRAIVRTSTSENYRVLFWILVTASVFLLVILSQIDATLAGMRAADTPAVDLGRLAGGLGDWMPGDNSKRITAGVEAWQAHATTLREDGLPYSRPLPIAALHILVDTFLFLPCYAAVLWLLIGRGTNIVASRSASLLDRPVLKDAFDAAFGIGFWLLTLLFASDLLENAMQAHVIAEAWRAQLNAGWAYGLWSAAMLKWTLFLGVILCIAVMGIATYATTTSEKKLEWRERLTNLRFEILLVSLFGILLLVPEQAWDIPRRWNLRTGFLGIAATALFSYFAWEFTARLIRVAINPTPRKEFALRTLSWSGFLFLVVGILLYLGADHLEIALAPWGIAIPGAFALVTSLLSWVVDRQRLKAQLLQQVSQTQATEPQEDESPVTDPATSPETTTWTTRSDYGLRGPRRIAIASVVSGVVALVGLVMMWATELLKPWGGVLTVAGLVSFFCFFGSWWGPADTDDPPGELDDWGPRFVAALPLILLGLALVRSSVGQLVYARTVSGGSMATLFLIGVLLPVLSFGLVSGFKTTAVEAPWYRALSLRLLAIGAGFVLVVGIFVDSSLWLFSEALGSVGILALFFLSASLVGAGLAFLGARMSPPTIFQVFNLKAIPVVSILLLWLVIATKIESGGYHDVRLKPEDSNTAKAQTGTSVSDEFDRWLARNDLGRYAPATAAQVAPSKKPGTPLVIVAASGGGIRAAYWTANVLDCLFLADAQVGDSCDQKSALPDDARSDRVFAIGGISGGSLGAASFNAYLLNHPDGQHPDRSWVRDSLDHDFLAPNLAWQLFVETPRAFLRINPDKDRAEILERAWERAWKTSGGPDALSNLLLESHDLDRTPLLVLNGASVNEGCRFIASPLNSSPRGAPERCLSSARFDEPTHESPDKPSIMAATQDLVDFLCSDQDVKLSTAALLSARFPFVSPSGRLEAQCTDSNADPPTTYVVDGGYFDTSAASPLVELWNSLEPFVNRYNRSPSTESCVVPFFVQVDNGYEVPDATLGDEKPGELTVPRKAAGQTRGAWLNHAKESAGIAFHRPLDAADIEVSLGETPLLDRYAHIYPRAHPGVQAPLGWVLSPAATEDLDNQLNSKLNQPAIDEVRHWLTEDLSCTFASVAATEATG